MWLPLTQQRFDWNEEDARRKAEAEAKRKAEEESKRKAEEARGKAEEEARRKAQAEAKRKAEEEAKRKAAAAAARAEVGLAPSASDAELAQAQAKTEARAALGLAPSASDEEVAQAQKLKAYIVTPSGSEMKDWLLSKGFAEENDRGRILLQFLKPEYEVTTLLELFALEDADIDEILQGLPLAKRRVLKASIKQDRDGI